MRFHCIYGMILCYFLTNKKNKVYSLVKMGHCLSFKSDLAASTCTNFRLQKMLLLLLLLLFIHYSGYKQAS